MGWDEVKKINSDMKVPLDVYQYMNDYKLWGKDSYVYQDKNKLHKLYETVIVSMNDLKLNGEAFEYLTANNKHIGKALSNVYDIEQKEELSTLTTMEAVAASSTAMEAVLASSTAMQAVLASSTAMQAVAASSTAMQAVAASSTAMQAVLASSTAMQAVLASSTAMQEVAASSTAMQAVINSGDAKYRIAKSAIALAEICKSREASLYFKNSFHSYRHDILLTLLNSPQYFSKLDTEWYHYGDKAGSTIKVAGDNTIVIPKSMWCYYNWGGYGQLFNGSDQSKIKEIENMSQDYEYLINDIVSFRGMYFRGGPYVRTYATVFAIKEE